MIWVATATILDSGLVGMKLTCFVLETRLRVVCVCLRWLSITVVWVVRLVWSLGGQIFTFSLVFRCFDFVSRWSAGGRLVSERAPEILAAGRGLAELSHVIWWRTCTIYFILLGR